MELTRKPKNGRRGIRKSITQPRQSRHEEMQPRRHEDTWLDKLAMSARPELVEGRAFVPSWQACAVVSSWRSVHHFSVVNESGFSDSRCRNNAITIARPTAASAAATVMTKKTMIFPSAAPRARPKATNVRVTAL